MISWLLQVLGLADILPRLLCVLGFANVPPAQLTASTPDSAPSSPAPPVEAQRPEFEKREDGSAHFEFSGTQRSTKNVTVREKADTSLTAWMNNATISGKSVKNSFHGEQSADVRYNNATIESTEEDIDLYIKGGRSKWIPGQTKANIMDTEHYILLQLWESYRKSGRNESIKDITSDMLGSRYKDTEEGLAKLRRFVIGYLAETNGEEAG